MPNAGWEPIDEDLRPFQDPTLKNIKGFMRSYQQAEQKRLVLFWESTTPGEKYEEEFPNPLDARFKALLESWGKAELTLPPQYSVSIAPLTQDLKLASLIAEQFAHDLSPILVAVGIQNN